MKRTLIILSFFVLLFALLCVSGCDCNSDGEGCIGCRTETAIGSQACTDFSIFDCFECDFCYGSSYSCFEAGDENVELNGCYISNSCIDCFWAPKACGCYENKFSVAQTNDKLIGCIGTPSCVVFGFDFTLWECYTPSDVNSAVDNREVVEAIEGVDYIIDRVTYTADMGDFNVFTDGKLTADDIAVFIQKVMMYGEDAVIYCIIEYTALTELNRVEGGFEIEYNGYEWNNYDSGAYGAYGNIEDRPTKDRNIQPGKHVLKAGVELDMYEILKLKDFNGQYLNAYKYVED